MDAVLGVVGRRKWIVLGAVVLGIAVATLVSAFQEPTYRASVGVVVGQGNGPLKPGDDATAALAKPVAKLVKSTLVATNVIANLKLRETPNALLGKISASADSGVVRISVTDHDRLRARRIAQEVGLVFPQLVAERFGAGKPGVPPLTAAIWDPAHVERGRVSPKPARNVVIGALLGLLLGLGLALALDRARWTRPAPVMAPVRGGIDEKESRRQRAALKAEPEPVPEPEPAPAPEPVPVADLAPVEAGEWNVFALERLIGAHAARIPERIEELRYYTLYLRDFADSDGRLPSSFDALVWEVFGDLVERAPA